MKLKREKNETIRKEMIFRGKFERNCEGLQTAELMECVKKPFVSNQSSLEVA